MGAKRPLKKTENRRRPKKVKEKTFFARRFQTIFKQKCSYLRPLLSITFPQGFRIYKNIGHPTSGSGVKKTLKRYLKSEQTDRHTETQTDGQIDLQKASAQRADALKKTFFYECKIQNNVQMSDNTVISCLYDYRVHCDYCNDCVKTNVIETCPNLLCHCDSCKKTHP